MQKCQFSVIFVSINNDPVIDMAVRGAASCRLTMYLDCDVSIVKRNQGATRSIFFQDTGGSTRPLISGSMVIFACLQCTMLPCAFSRIALIFFHSVSATGLAAMKLVGSPGLFRVREALNYRVRYQRLGSRNSTNRGLQKSPAIINETVKTDNLKC